MTWAACWMSFPSHGGASPHAGPAAVRMRGAGGLHARGGGRLHARARLFAGGRWFCTERGRHAEADGRWQPTPTPTANPTSTPMQAPMPASNPPPPPQPHTTRSFPSDSFLDGLLLGTLEPASIDPEARAALWGWDLVGPAGILHRWVGRVCGWGVGGGCC